MRTFRLVGVLNVLAAAMIGCSTPTVPIEHSLPRAVPPPGGVERFKVGVVTVTPRDDADLAGFTKQVLQTALEQRVNASDGGAASIVRVNLRADVNDQRSQRVLRGAGGQPPETVASFIREATVVADFVITPPGGSSSVTCRSEASYSSLADPRTRGPVGLARPDDPRNVPPAKLILQELARDCIEKFTGMISPVEVRTKVPLRWSSADGAAEALKRAEAGEYQAARAGFASAVEKKDQPALHFNLAVLAEATGDVATAVNHYQAALDADPQDEQAAEGLRRARNVLRVLRWAENSPAGQAGGDAPR